jgi:hypothetical protein
VPEGEAWRTEPGGEAATLLQHTDLAAWFDAHFFPQDYTQRRGGPPPVPPVLAEAREQLAPVLFTQAVLDAASENAADAS